MARKIRQQLSSVPNRSRAHTPTPATPTALPRTGGIGWKEGHFRNLSTPVYQGCARHTATARRTRGITMIHGATAAAKQPSKNGTRHVVRSNVEHLNPAPFPSPLDTPTPHFRLTGFHNPVYPYNPVPMANPTRSGGSQLRVGVINCCQFSARHHPTTR
jgi:hypothetical protein